MPENDDRSSRRGWKLRQAGAWAGAAAVYAAAQGLSAWAAQRQSGRGTRPQYSQFELPAFAPPGAVFPVVWSALNLTTATSAWRIWRAPEPAAGKPSRGEVLAWWAAAVVIRSGYVPLAFGRRRLWAATADAALLFAVMARYGRLARRSTSPRRCWRFPRSPGRGSPRCSAPRLPRSTAGKAATRSRPGRAPRRVQRISGPARCGEHPPQAGGALAGSDRGVGHRVPAPLLGRLLPRDQ